ncbi:MAG: potassium-transporting ATPase subunit KdpC [Candidatus Berkiella sp.]
MDKISLRSQVKSLIILLFIFSFLLGFIYPGIIMFINQLAFPNKSNGSLIVEDTLLGSELIGQSFEKAKFFWGRPSSTTPEYDPSCGHGSNLSPSNPKLLENIQKRIKKLKGVDPHNNALIPIDLVCASGSGLDPHISVAAAYYQIPRIAKERHLKEEFLYAIVNAAIEPRQFGFLGEPRVNVVKLNLYLYKTDRTYYGTRASRS